MEFNSMQEALSWLVLLLAGATLVGLIRPSLVLPARWEPSRRKAAGIYGVLTFASILVFVSIPEERARLAEQQATRRAEADAEAAAERARRAEQQATRQAEADARATAERAAALVDDALDALTLLYIKRKIYDPVQCRAKEVVSKQFIKCIHSPWAEKPGGLWLAIPEGTAVSVAPVNGKAIQHLGSAISIEMVNGKLIQVTQAPQEAKDIITMVNASFFE